MTKRGNLAIGPGAASLILVSVVLSLTVLGRLSLMGAKNDLRLASRSAQVTASVYELNAQAERALSRLDARAHAALAAGGQLQPEDGEVIDGESSTADFSLTDGVRTLTLTAALPRTAEEHAAWRVHRLAVETEEEEWN